MSYIIRKAEPNDLAQVEACVFSAFNPYVEELGVVMSPLKDDFGEMIERQIVYVYQRDDGSVMGIFVLLWEPNHCVFDNISFFPQYQGSIHMMRVLRFIIPMAVDHDVEFIRGYVNEKVVSNIKLYEKLGCEVYKTVEHEDRVVAHIRFDMKQLTSNLSEKAKRLGVRTQKGADSSPAA